MPATIDYDNLRNAVGFNWSVSVGQSFLIDLAGISFRDFYLEPKACIDAYRKGIRAVEEWFGSDVTVWICTPAIRYGHVNCLGAELRFPERGEVAPVHLYPSLDEAMRALSKPLETNAASCLFSFYLEFREEMKQAFPDKSVGFAFGYEGPLTTGWELRGEEFFVDLHDHPDEMKIYLNNVTDSIDQYYRLLARIFDMPVMEPEGYHFGDDIASLISPAGWPEFVLPSWERMYSYRTSGQRRVHVENLCEAHLRFLEEIGMVYYDPGLSRQLTPQTISRNCRVPFGWSLQGHQLPRLSGAEVKDSVTDAARDGASRVCLDLEWGMANENTVDNVRVFMDTARQVKESLCRGVSRTDL